MAKADSKHFGPAARGKSDGTGAMTELDTAAIPANVILSNRDKSRHSDERGLDGKTVLTEQYQDHAANRRIEEEDEREAEIVRDRSAVLNANDDRT